MVSAVEEVVEIEEEVEFVVVEVVVVVEFVAENLDLVDS